ncbi:hypothetical protein I4J89_38420 [Actinoplanes sp. NEAU-A11]|uniref:Uncharacterized protein n=1 Tax=Actinoplanes aureus TaxID=2792083 RepID=A0A931G260_9ACTN|nr:hypothetical protein [Actinoplanes aureus]
MVTALMVVAAIVALPGSAEAAQEPPGGRANYTVALMRNVGTESFVRLAQYSLRADGTIRADYWAWNAQQTQPNVSSGLRTLGCANTCDIWTPNGFQSAPKQLYGTWSLTSTDDLSITWTSGSSGVERWKFANLATATQLTLASHPTANTGWGWGSRIGFNTGVPARTIFESNILPLSGPWSQNNWGEVLGGITQLQMTANGTLPVHLCDNNDGNPGNDHCINVTTPAIGDKPENKAYIGGTGTDRRMFYNHELKTVNSGPCPARGHLKAALQILDDNGTFRGLIMVEASLAAKTYGTNILGIFDLNNID